MKISYKNMWVELKSFVYYTYINPAYTKHKGKSDGVKVYHKMNELEEKEKTNDK